MRAVVTGSSGYIGSAMVAELSAAGHRVLGLDINPPRQLHKGLTSLQIDLVKSGYSAVLQEFDPDVIFHFAGVALVGESMSQPEKYFENNTSLMITLLSELDKAKVAAPFVFSSSCAVYGVHKDKILEDSVKIPTNPYGVSKLLSEEILRVTSELRGFPAVALRYFNVVGVHSPAHFEGHEPETHLVPNLTMAAMNGLPFQVFGTDFATRDGSAERDYIHITDLIEGHILAWEFTRREGQPGFKSFNLGTGVGTTVIEAIHVAQEVFGPVEVQRRERRPGDPDSLVAVPDLARRTLGFQCRKLDLKTAILETAGSILPSHGADP